MNNALETLVSRMDVKYDTCIASIPAANASFRNLQMPFKDRKRIAQILPFEMETLVPYPIDDVLIDFIIIDGADQGEVLAVSNDDSLMGDVPATRESVRLRNTYTDPLNLLQVELLRRYRADGEQRHAQALMVSIAGIAAGLRNTG